MIYCLYIKNYFFFNFSKVKSAQLFIHSMCSYLRYYPFAISHEIHKWQDLDTCKTDIKEALNLFQEFVFQSQIIFEIDYTEYISHLHFLFPQKMIFGIFSENSFLSFVIEYQHYIHISR